MLTQGHAPTLSVCDGPLGGTVLAASARLRHRGWNRLYGQGVATPDELDGQTSIEEVLAELGEPWTAEPSERAAETPTLF